MDFLGISVVVPTRNRSEHVAGLLASLRSAAGQFGGPSEILLVDDSDPAEAAAIEKLCERSNARFLRGTASVRQKRNLGVEEASYRVILFVDSDCQAAPDLFSQHARIYAQLDPAVAAVVGVTEFVGRESWMWEVIRRTQFLNAFTFARRMENVPWATCSNTSYLRDVLRQLGGFDVSFPFRLGGDDVDLGIRVNNAGYRMQSNLEAVVTHTRETWDSFIKVWRRALRWGRMDVHLYFRKHNDRLDIGMPKLTQVFLLLGLPSLLQAVVTRAWWPLALPFFWAIAAILLQAGLTVVSRREPWKCFLQELAADLLGLTFESGAIVEGLWRGELAVLWKAVRRGPVLPGFDQKEWVLQAWSMWLAVSLLLAVDVLLH